MFLVSYPVPDSAGRQLVFCLADPWPAGYRGRIEYGVELDAPALSDASLRRAGDSRVVGRDPDAPTRYRIFGSVTACLAAGFRSVGPMPVVVSRWTAALEAELTRAGAKWQAGAATVASVKRPAMAAR